MATVDAASVKNKNTNKSCPSICTADYTPVCAADPGDQTSTPRLFGNKCVLSVHNCEHNSSKIMT